MYACAAKVNSICSVLELAGQEVGGWEKRGGEGVESRGEARAARTVRSGGEHEAAAWTRGSILRVKVLW